MAEAYINMLEIMDFKPLHWFQNTMLLQLLKQQYLFDRNNGLLTIALVSKCHVITVIETVMVICYYLLRHLKLVSEHGRCSISNARLIWC